MNRLILIGNGFDLAHGLKTDYNSFILWYLKKCLTKAFDPGSLHYEDDLISVDTIIPNHPLKFSSSIDNQINGISDLVDHYYKAGFSELFDQEWLYTNTSERIRNPFKIKTKSIFFNSLIRKCSHSNWVAIENEFYKSLKIYLTNPPTQNQLALLNNSLRTIISELQIYLSTIDTKIVIEDYRELLSSHNDNCMILNFNYTNTIENYITNDLIEDAKKYRESDYYVNHIHGKLNDNDNPLIFGFGDEIDEDYRKMELMNNNAFFEFIKSFWYFKTDNYNNLVKFLNHDYYEVLIIGHSCGLSDRTLLNMIFEHNKCESIKIIFHQRANGNNYTDLTYEISRHFRDKIQMRKRMVPFPNCLPMPQYDSSRNQDLAIA